MIIYHERYTRNLDNLKKGLIMRKRNFMMAFAGLLIASNVSLMGMGDEKAFIEKVKEEGLGFIETFTPVEQACAYQSLIDSDLLMWWDTNTESIRLPAAYKIKELGDKFGSDFESRAVKAFLSIAQNDKIHGAYRVDALIGLKKFDLSISFYNDSAKQAALSLALESRVDLAPRFRLAGIESVLRLAPEHKAQMCQKLDAFIQQSLGLLDCYPYDELVPMARNILERYRVE